MTDFLIGRVKRKKDLRINLSLQRRRRSNKLSLHNDMFKEAIGSMSK